MATSARKENRWKRIVQAANDAENWMRRNAQEFETATELAEAANAALRLPPDAMDDECHWVWEEALSALE